MRLSPAAALIAAALTAATAAAGDWPQWRGPDADGVSAETGLPVTWSASENVAWKVELAGVGGSTPIVWGDLVIVTSQVGAGPVEERGRGRRDGDAAPPPPADDVRFVVEAFRRGDGERLWRHELAARRLIPVHPKHNLASPSPVTDGEGIYALFGTGQLLALDLSGKLVWQRHLGEDYGPFQLLWAHGSSPVLHRDSLFLLCDHDPAAYLLALDKATGETRWKVDRGQELRSYSTPLLVRGEKGDELIVNSNPRIDAYDPATGALLWYADPEVNRVPVPTPVAADGVIYASRGYRSGPYMALRPGGRGDVSASHILWRIATGAPYVSSLLYYRGLVYMADETGIASAVDAATGERVWRERLGGYFSASPVAADGKVYLLNEDGEAFVLAAGRSFSLLAKNALGERTLASPAVAGGRIFLRSDRHLFAIGR